MILSFKVDRQYVSPLSLAGNRFPASGSVGYLYATFTFTPDWQGLVRTAIFTAPDGQVYSTLLDTNDTCLVPWEAIQAGELLISVRGDGEDGAVLVTTMAYKLRIAKSGITDDTPRPPTPDVYAIIIDLMQTQAIDATRAETAQEEAEQARDDAGAFAEQTALDRTATGADRTATGEDRAAVNTALSGFAESTLPNAIQAVGDKADAEITRVGQAGDAQVSAVETAGAEQIAAATEQADRAESEADKSTTQATKSESYAVGGTGTRPGEDTDNSKHYSEVALNNILNGVTAHNENADAHQSIQDDLRNVEAIARGRATAHVFDTYEDMAYWLSVPENVAELVMGDNLYIRDTAVKDYWWDGTQISELEAEAPDLTDYYTKSQVDAMLPIQISRTDYDALVAAGTIEAGRSYDVREVT